MQPGKIAPHLIGRSNKAALRTHFRQLRRDVSPEHLRESSARIADAVRMLPEYKAARAVHVYWPAVGGKEIDTRPLIEELVARNAKVVLPVVRVFDRYSEEPRLQHAEYVPGERMRPNRWAIPEPASPRPFPVDAIDLVIVPALACDRNGVRLGHGYGYYDEFLAQTRAIRVCPCIDGFLVDELPSDPHDESVDIVVTETELVRTPQRGKP